MRGNFCRARILAACFLLVSIVHPILPRSFENVHQRTRDFVGGVTYPTLQPPEAETETVENSTPTDLDLTFDTMSTPADIEGKAENSESSETTTSVTSSSSVVVKSGRHFGSRYIPARSSATTPPGINDIPTSLKSRPSSLPISYNPTNYNRILKRRQNQTATVINPELSAYKNRGSPAPPTLLSETTEALPPPNPSTSQIPHNNYKGNSFPTSALPQPLPSNDGSSIAETEFPTTTNFPQVRNIKVKIGAIPLPRLPTPKTQESTAPSLNKESRTHDSAGAEDLIQSSHSWDDTHRGPMPPPPTFDPEEDFTLYPDGIYKFKYSSSISFPPTFASSRTYMEEYGITSGDGQWDPNGEIDYGKDAQGHTTAQMSPLDETIPATTSAPTAPAVIDASEDEHIEHSISSVYRDYFNRDEPDLKPRQVDESHGIKQVTVTVTVTEKVNASQKTASPNPQVETVQNDINFQVVPTPVLPDSDHFSKTFSEPFDDEGSNATAKDTLNLNPTRVENVSAMSPQSDIHRDSEQQDQELFLVSSPKFDLEPTPLTVSKEYKSVYYSTEQQPHFTSTSYSYTSSTEFAFTYPEEDEDHHHHHFHDQNDNHDHQPDENHQLHHHPGVGHANNAQKNFIQPSTSLYNWDSLGLKTNEVNQSTSARPTGSQGSAEVVLVVTTPQSTQFDGNELRNKGPDPTITPPPTQEDSRKIIGGTTQASPVVDSPVTPIGGDHAHETVIATTARESEDNGESSGNPDMRHQHLPSVPSYIQILLDIPLSEFCSSVKDFKETITLVYKYNHRHITTDQVVLHNEPLCISSLKQSKHKSVRRRSSNSSPATNSAWNAGNNFKDEIDSSEAKENKTWREIVSDEIGIPVTPLLPVYVYIVHKNGTYDQLLTELFIDLWNVTKGQDVLLFSKIKKVEMIISSDVIGGEGPVNENTGVIVAISVASIAAFCFLILGILLLVMRHRQAQNNFAKRCTPVTLDDYSLDNISVFNSFRRKQRNRGSKRSYTNAGFDDPNAPTRVLDIDGLGTAVKEVGGIFEEFSRIPSVLPTLDDIPAGAESKNRYANVIPMPDTRVLLTFQDEQPNSDYINANFAQGGKSNNKAYIITQGPLEETLTDFWRMIWEQQVRVIFMLTDFAEAGIPKCAEYYPRSETIECSQLHGDYQITLEKREVSENCITSFLVLKDMSRSLRRDVVHLWFHSWPEKGVPQTPQATIDFILKSRKYTREPTPILVHCSPGTGRSGTIVACDIGLRQLEADRKVDIPQIVKQLRHDRAGAVQTKEQYRHIFEVLQHYGAKYLSRQSKDS